MKPKEIAERIDAHLKRLGADTEINIDSSISRKRFWHPCVTHGSKYIRIQYKMGQFESKLTGEEAEAYLKYLDNGGIEYHYTPVQQYRESDHDKPMPVPIRHAYGISGSDIVRETPKTVEYHYENSREIRQSRKAGEPASSWFKTWDKAHAWLIEHTEFQIAGHVDHIERLYDRLTALKAMEKPEDVVHE